MWCWKILNIIEFDEDALPEFVPLDDGETSSGDKGNEYFSEVDDTSNTNSSPPVHIDII